MVPGFSVCSDIQLARRLFFCKSDLLIQQFFFKFLSLRVTKMFFLYLPFSLNMGEQYCFPFEYRDLGPSCSEEMSTLLSLLPVVLIWWDYSILHHFRRYWYIFTVCPQPSVDACFCSNIWDIPWLMWSGLPLFNVKFSLPHISALPETCCLM